MAKRSKVVADKIIMTSMRALSFNSGAKKDYAVGFYEKLPSPSLKVTDTVDC